VMILSMGFSIAGRLAAAAPEVKRRYAAPGGGSAPTEQPLDVGQL